MSILKKREYLGHTVNFKTRKHFKDKKSHYVDESEWTIFENSHEAIIDQESELATMPGDRCILQLRGLPPFYSKKYDLKQHPNYRFTAEADKVKNAFDLDRLIDRRRRPGMNEECEVYEVSVPDEALTDEDEDILNYDDLDDPDAFV